MHKRLGVAIPDPTTMVMIVVGLALMMHGTASAGTDPPAAVAFCNADNNSAPVKITMFNGLDNALIHPLTNIFTQAQQSATFIWKSLATLEVAWFLVTNVARKKAFEDILGDYTYKMVGLFFILGLITSIGNSGGQLIYNIVVKDFGQMGQTVGRQIESNAPPADIQNNKAVENVLENGECAAINITLIPADIWNAQIKAQQALASQQAGGLNPVGAALTGITTVMANLATGATFIPAMIASYTVGMAVAWIFAFLAGELLFVIFEGMLILAVGLVLLGFGASRWTAPIAANYFRYAISMGFKIFALELVIGLATGLINSTIKGLITQTQALAGAPPPGPNAPPPNFLTMYIAGPAMDISGLIQITLVAGTIYMLAKNVNGIANALQGAPNMNMGLGHQAVQQATNTVKGTAVAVVTAGAGAAALGAASRAGGALESVKAAASGASEAGKAGKQAAGGLEGTGKNAPPAPAVRSVSSDSSAQPKTAPKAPEVPSFSSIVSGDTNGNSPNSSSENGSGANSNGAASSSNGSFSNGSRNSSGKNGLRRPPAGLIAASAVSNVLRGGNGGGSTSSSATDSGESESLIAAGVDSGSNDESESVAVAPVISGTVSRGNGGGRNIKMSAASVSVAAAAAIGAATGGNSRAATSATNSGGTGSNGTSNAAPAPSAATSSPPSPPANDDGASPSSSTAPSNGNGATNSAAPPSNANTSAPTPSSNNSNSTSSNGSPDAGSAVLASDVAEADMLDEQGAMDDATTARRERDDKRRQIQSAARAIIQTHKKSQKATKKLRKALDKVNSNLQVHNYVPPHGASIEIKH